MASFKDAKGREWKLKPITVGDLDALGEVGLDVEAVSEDPTRLEVLARKPRLFAAVLWAFVGEEVTSAGLTPADFNSGLGGDALFGALEAITDTIVDFFPMPASERAKMLEKARKRDGSGGPASTSPESPGSTPDRGPSDI